MKDALKELLKEHLKVEVTFGRDYDPNTLSVRLLFDGELIDSDEAWIRIRPEYEG